MKCALKISNWEGYKYDRDVSDQIAEIHRAARDSGRFNKRLLPLKDLAEITKAIGQARRDHEFLTLPWGDDGYRVLPAATYMEHTNTMRLRATEFQAAYSRLEARFEDLVNSQSRLGSMFNIEDYPGMRKDGEKFRFIFPNELREKFSFKTDVLPLGDASDFRVNISDDERERIKRQLAESIQASLRAGSRELWQRLYTVVSHMSARMAEYNSAEEGSRPKLYKSMVTNIVELVDVLPKLNIAGDTELNRMANDVRKSLMVDTVELRKSDTLRSDTARAAADIVQRMAAYMGMPTTPQQAVS
jgi:hypothetical protein